MALNEQLSKVSLKLLWSAWHSVCLLLIDVTGFQFQKLGLNWNKSLDSSSAGSCRGWWGWGGGCYPELNHSISPPDNGARRATVTRSRKVCCEVAPCGDVRSKQGISLCDRMWNMREPSRGLFGPFKQWSNISYFDQIVDIYLPPLLRSCGFSGWRLMCARQNICVGFIFMGRVLCACGPWSPANTPQPPARCSVPPVWQGSVICAAVYQSFISKVTPWKPSKQIPK